MDTLCQQFHLQYRYPVHFVHGVFGAGAAALEKSLALVPGDRPQVLCVIDSGVLEHHPELPHRIHDWFGNRRSPDVVLAGPPAILTIPGGEQAKNDPAILQSIYAAINEHRICRHSYVLAIGGGAVLDVVGYASATAHRGVRHIRVPTTVLSQNDSGVGVKNSINAFGKKNFLGTFAPPLAVINDAQFLTTLSQRDWLSGISEAIKVALIRDAEFFGWIAQYAPALLDREMGTMQTLIHRCAALHLNHIGAGGDPFETGTSRPLDFGHWAAHRLEHLTTFSLRHGEAVAIGLALDVMYSQIMGWLAPAQATTILQTIARCGLPTTHPMLARHEALLQGIEDFREHLGGQLTLTMLRSIGQPVEIHQIDRAQMIRAMQSLGD